MAAPKEISKARCGDGALRRYEHVSPTLGGVTMKYSVYVPDGESSEKFPVVFWLSGLTCTDENFSQKAGAFPTAAKLRLILVLPDTSPRGEDVPDDAAWDFGQGAGFYLNATTEKFKKHYNMLDYVTKELHDLVMANQPVLPGKVSIMGHSMGGHGALTIALKNPGKYCSVSAFAPIANPSQVPWGQKAFSQYLGDDKSAWNEYDTVELLKKYEGPPVRILVDQGTADSFLKDQLKPESLQAVCEEKGVICNLRMREGHGHSYDFISTYIQDHLQYHASNLTGMLRWCPDQLPTASVYSQAAGRCRRPRARR